MMFIKICGITNYSDAKLAISCGATALGFIFYPQSPRYIKPQKANLIIQKLPRKIHKIGVFVDAPAEDVNVTAAGIGLTHVQLHGNENPAYCGEMQASVIKAFRIKDNTDIEKMRGFTAPLFLLDAFSKNAYGGTGKTFDWSLALEAAKLGTPIILSGGLDPENVSEAIKKVHPFGVDVSSGVEIKPGRKNPEKVKLFIERAIESFNKIPRGE
jgi:phosphoribosylanthranilate isomerase